MLKGAKATDHQTNRLLAALEPEDFASLRPDLAITNLSAGTVLYEPGQPIEHAYFPHDAIISLIILLEDGGSAEVAVIGREGVVGFTSALVTRNAFGRYLVQLAGTASKIPLERLLQAVEAHPALRQLLLRYAEAVLLQTFQTVACNALHSVEARCCRWLLFTHDRVGQDDLPLTHEFLALMLGVQRSTVSIIARTLQTAGFIKQRRGVITVTNRAGLEEAACECYVTIRHTFERLLPRTYSER